MAKRKSGDLDEALPLRRSKRVSSDSSASTIISQCTAFVVYRDLPKGPDVVQASTLLKMPTEVWKIILKHVFDDNDEIWVSHTYNVLTEEEWTPGEGRSRPVETPKTVLPYRHLTKLASVSKVFKAQCEPFIQGSEGSSGFTVLTLDDFSLTQHSKEFKASQKKLFNIPPMVLSNVKELYAEVREMKSLWYLDIASKLPNLKLVKLRDVQHRNKNGSITHGQAAQVFTGALALRSRYTESKRAEVMRKTIDFYLKKRFKWGEPLPANGQRQWRLEQWVKQLQSQGVESVQMEVLCTYETSRPRHLESIWRAVLHVLTMDLLTQTGVEAQAKRWSGSNQSKFNINMTIDGVVKASQLGRTVERETRWSYWFDIILRRDWEKGPCPACWEVTLNKRHLSCVHMDFKRDYPMAKVSCFEKVSCDPEWTAARRIGAGRHEDWKAVAPLMGLIGSSENAEIYWGRDWKDRAHVVGHYEVD